MKNLLVLIPENPLVEYFIFSYDENSRDYEYILKSKGRVKFSSFERPNEEMNALLINYKPDLIATRVLYGGTEFNESEIYNEDSRKKLAKLLTQSPIHISMVIKLLNFLERTTPSSRVILFSETAFFANLPAQEQLYAVDKNLLLGSIRRFGYHGIFHRAALEKIKKENKNARKIISICLEPVPEVSAINNFEPIMVSSGSTPLEGLPGNTVSGEIDPGIVFLLEEKKKLGPEMINEILTKESGLSALAGERVTIDTVFNNEDKYKLARQLFEYRILLSCGSAIAVMNGVDAVVFSGKYIDAAINLSDWLIPKLTGNNIKKASPKVYFLKDSLPQIIVQNIFEMSSSKGLEEECVNKPFMI